MAQNERFVRERVVNLTVNGVKMSPVVSVDTRLLDFLRDELNLKSVKEGCSVGDCGACTVLIDQKPIHSCIAMVAELEGADIVTTEGLTTDGSLTDIQQAFLDHGAVQCGFCTSGMVLTTTGILAEKPDISEEDMKLALSGNLCRCTGYTNIFEAIKAVQKDRKRKQS